MLKVGCCGGLGVQFDLHLADCYVATCSNTSVSLELLWLLSQQQTGRCNSGSIQPNKAHKTHRAGRQSRPWTERGSLPQVTRPLFSSVIQSSLSGSSMESSTSESGSLLILLQRRLHRLLNKPKRFSRSQLCADCSKVNLRHMEQTHRSWSGFGWRNGFQPLRVLSLGYVLPRHPSK